MKRGKCKRKIKKEEGKRGNRSKVKYMQTRKNESKHVCE
jgi:hypothetical protein